MSTQEDNGAADQSSHDMEYEDPSEDALLPPPDFKPFFTLIEDPETGEDHHPAVHYIFADDDPDLFTNAVLDACEGQKQDGVEERVVVLDLGPDGTTVLSASSLSADWQALKASVGQAPTWGNSETGSGSKMLKISGCQRGRQGHLAPVEDVEAAAVHFSKRLDDLERALGNQSQDVTLKAV